MHVWSFKRMQAGDLGESPIVELAPAQDEKVCFVSDDLVATISLLPHISKAKEKQVTTYRLVHIVHDLETPCSFVFIPDCILDPVVELDILSNLVLIGNSCDVLVNLFSTGVVRGPVWVVLEQEREAWGWDIASHSRVAVFKPDTADI